MLRQHVVQQRQVVQALKFRVSEQPEAVRVFGRGLQRRGQRIERERHVRPCRGHDAVRKLLAADACDRRARDRLRLRGVRVEKHDCRVKPLEQSLDALGMVVQELRRDDEVRGDELAVRPKVALIDQHAAAALDHEPAGPGLGQPCAIDLALLESVERHRVVLRQHCHIAAAERVGPESLALQVPAQRHVLGPAELRVGDLLAA